MGRLEYTLEVRGIPLGQRKLLPKPVQGDSPGQHALGAREFNEAVKPPGDWRWEPKIPADVERYDVTGGHILAYNWRDNDASFTRLCSDDRWKESELVALRRSSSLNHYGAEKRETDVGDLGGHGIDVASLRLESSSLEARERAAELLVRAAIHLAAHGPQKRMQRERQHAIRRLTSLLVPAHQLDVNILVECAR